MTDLSYHAFTRPDSLSAAMDSSVTNVVLADGTSFPDPATPGIGQYTVILAYGTDREEVCTVTAKLTANTLTVVRHEDGTLATDKNPGDVVVHGVSARDFNATVKEGDARLDDPRVPTAHAATHATGGGDAVTPAAIGALATAGGTMTGPTIANASVTVNAPLIVNHTSTPEVTLVKVDGQPDLRRWKVYVAGSTGETGEYASSLAFVAEKDDASDLAVVRFYRDGRILLGTDPTLPLQAATKRYVDTDADITVGTVATVSPWVINSQTLVRKNGWVKCQFRTVRTTAAAAGQQIATIPTGFRPDQSWYPIAGFGDNYAPDGQYKTFAFQVDATGAVRLYGLLFPIANEDLYFTATWPVA